MKSFINNSDDIDHINEIFSNVLMELAETIPKVSFTYCPNDKPWMNTSIRRNMRQRDRLYLKAKTKTHTKIRSKIGVIIKTKEMK